MNLPGIPGGTRREGRVGGEDRRASIAFPGRASAVEAIRQDSGRRGLDGRWAVPRLGPVAHARIPGPEEDRLSGRAAGGEVRAIGQVPEAGRDRRAADPVASPGAGRAGDRRAAHRGRRRPRAAGPGRTRRAGYRAARAPRQATGGFPRASRPPAGPGRSRAGARVSSGAVSAANEGVAPRAADPQESVTAVSRAAGGAASARTGSETVGVRPGAGKAGSDRPRRGELSMHCFGRKGYNPMIIVA